MESLLGRANLDGFHYGFELPLEALPLAEHPSGALENPEHPSGALENPELPLEALSPSALHKLKVWTN